MLLTCSFTSIPEEQSVYQVTRPTTNSISFKSVTLRGKSFISPPKEESIEQLVYRYQNLFDVMHIATPLLFYKKEGV